MTQLLSVALRGILPPNVRLATVKLCAFLSAIFQKAIIPTHQAKLQNDMVQCLISFELVFPPSFFNIMTHLLVHLIKEISILGPMFLHNMFLFERFMGVIKKYVHNHVSVEDATSVQLSWNSSLLEQPSSRPNGNETLMFPHDRRQFTFCGFGLYTVNCLRTS